MPIYEYRCKQCGHTFEKLVASSQVNEPVICSECESLESTRQFSTFGVGTANIAGDPTTDIPSCGTCGRSTPQPCS